MDNERFWDANSESDQHNLDDNDNLYIGTRDFDTYTHDETFACNQTDEWTNETEHDEEQDLDVNSKWSWKDLRREFKLTHSESLFHTYQARLQQSFFVVLLILNIIFNAGAVIVYLLSRFSDLYPCESLSSI